MNLTSLYLSGCYRHRWLLCLCLGGGVGLLGSVLPAAAASPPNVLPFQGYLTKPSGEPVSDGTHVVQFKLYDSPVSGNVVWAGEVHRLSVNSGLVNTILGSKTSFGDARSGGVDFSVTTYLEIAVDADGNGEITPADPPLLPRQIVLPALFALRAAKADLAAEADRAVEAQALNGFDWSALFVNETSDPNMGVFDGSRIEDGSITSSKLKGSPVSVTDDDGENSLRLYTRKEEVAEEGTVLLIHSGLEANAPDPDLEAIFVDSSQIASPKTITPEGQTSHRSNVRLDDFGETSIRFDGTDDYLFVDGEEDLDFQRNPFTIDFWARTESRVDLNNIAFSLVEDEWEIFLINLWRGGVQLSIHGDIEYRTEFNLVPHGTWAHYAIVRDADRVHVFINGSRVKVNGQDFISIGSEVSFSNRTAEGIFKRSVIGSRPDLPNAGSDFLGNMTEFRIVKNKAIWTSANFERPKAPYRTEPVIRLYGEDELGNQFRVKFDILRRAESVNED